MPIENMRKGARMTQSRNDFHVFRRGLEWAVTLHGIALDVFTSQKAAVNRAIDAAHQIGMQGRDAQVLLVEDNAAPRLQWVFGHHPYPPTA